MPPLCEFVHALGMPARKALIIVLEPRPTFEEVPIFSELQDFQRRCGSLVRIHKPSAKQRWKCKRHTASWTRLGIFLQKKAQYQSVLVLLQLIFVHVHLMMPDAIGTGQ